jgi:hypothetical protein
MSQIIISAHDIKETQPGQAFAFFAEKSTPDVRDSPPEPGGIRMCSHS